MGETVRGWVVYQIAHPQHPPVRNWLEGVGKIERGGGPWKKIFL